ncbi:hypothetical protein [Vannielia litorea]|uniref:Uncharacterized protein n=1 Tax=Vannielia litorea TaxID=1217970 RepID=A0A1N6EDC4_9RHOB|nr:hypothetical protein [Vannielia litorea]SIN81014.1 hypothetical protein SAMN05444002_0626 [Vannielia litorea]
MWQWLQQNQPAIQIVVSLTTTVVWIAYLHIFLVSFRRQTRSGLLINRAGRDGLEARCIVSNLGSEPAYLTDVLAEVEIGEDTITASVVDRLEMFGDGTRSETAQGPMASGAHVDIGSFEDIFERVHQRHGAQDIARKVDRIKRIKLIAVAATSQARDIVAAYRNFDITGSGERAVLRPVEVEAPQVRSWRQRRRLKLLLSDIQRGKTMERSASSQLFDRAGLPRITS